MNRENNVWMNDNWNLVFDIHMVYSHRECVFFFSLIYIHFSSVVAGMQPKNITWMALELDSEYDIQYYKIITFNFWTGFCSYESINVFYSCSFFSLYNKMFLSFILSYFRLTNEKKKCFTWIRAGMHVSFWERISASSIQAIRSDEKCTMTLNMLIRIYNAQNPL